MVMVVAVESVSHAGRPTFFDAASLLMLSNIERIFFGAGTGPGLAWAALMSSFNGCESLDMMSVLVVVGGGIDSSVTCGRTQLDRGR